MRELRVAVIALIWFTVLTGIVYPLAVTGVAQLVFRDQANGSLIVRNGHVVGSSLIGQQFSDPRYFWSRPSATTPFPYNSASSSGSNYGPLNPDLQKAVEQRMRALRAADPGNTQRVPVDLITSSASGLDPHISPAAASFQAARVARLRNLPLENVQRLIEAHTAKRQWGFLGEPTVNVLELNLALDQSHAPTGRASWRP